MKIYKPTTPARRGMTGIDFPQLTTKKPEKSLLKYVRRSKPLAAGRPSTSTGKFYAR